MDVKEHNINIMNEWRRGGGGNRMLIQGNTMKMHNGPQMLCSAQPAQKRNVFLFTTNLSSSQFPKHELSSQSIRKLS